MGKICLLLLAQSFLTLCHKIDPVHRNNSILRWTFMLKINKRIKVLIKKLRLNTREIYGGTALPRSATERKSLVRGVIRDPRRRGVKSRHLGKSSANAWLTLSHCERKKVNKSRKSPAPPFSTRDTTPCPTQGPITDKLRALRATITIREYSSRL